jgi:hypothetical protein
VREPLAVPAVADAPAPAAQGVASGIDWSPLGAAAVVAAVGEVDGETVDRASQLEPVEDEEVVAAAAAEAEAKAKAGVNR